MLGSATPLLPCPSSRGCLSIIATCPTIRQWHVRRKRLQRTTSRTKAGATPVEERSLLSPEIGAWALDLGNQTRLHAFTHKHSSKKGGVPNGATPCLNRR